MFAQMVAMVGNKDNDCLFSKIKPVKGFEEFTHARIHETGAGQIGLNCLTAQIVGQGRFFPLTVGNGRHWNPGVVPFWNDRQFDRRYRVHIKIFFGRHIRRMRPVKSHSQKERLILVFLKQANGMARCNAVCLLSIGSIGSQPTESGAKLPFG